MYHTTLLYQSITDLFGGETGIKDDRMTKVPMCIVKDRREETTTVRDTDVTKGDEVELDDFWIKGTPSTKNREQRWKRLVVPIFTRERIGPEIMYHSRILVVLGF